MITEALVTSSATSPFVYKKIQINDQFLLPTECLIRVKATGICPDHDLTFARHQSSSSSPSASSTTTKTSNANGAAKSAVAAANGSAADEYFPCVLGHEGAGLVSRVGDKVDRVKPGDRVILVYDSCGRCKYCRRRETGYCDLWFQLNLAGEGSRERGEDGELDGRDRKPFEELDSDQREKLGAKASKKKAKKITSHFFGQSSFARDVMVNESCIIRVPDAFADVPWEHLAALGCSVMTGAGATLNTLQPSPPSTDILAIIGMTATGIAAIMALKLLPNRRPRKVIAVDTSSWRLELAHTHGATHGVNSTLHRPGDLWKVLMDITDGRGVDGAIDTTGKTEVVEGLIHSAARRGRVISAGIGVNQLSAKPGLNIFEMIQGGATYAGCNQGDCYPQEFIPKLLEAHQQGMFPYERMIKTYRARDIQKAVSDVEKGATIKAVLLWD